MTVLMTPADVNVAGTVFGGSVLSLIDRVAAVCSSKYSGMLCVTASFDRVDFHSPVYVGELLHLVAHVAYTGRTSIGVGISIHAENVITGEVRHTNSSYVTMVAMKDGKPTPVPPLVCRTNEEKRRQLFGRYRRLLGEKQRETLRALEGMLAEASGSRLDELMASAKLPKV